MADDLEHNDRASLSDEMAACEWLIEKIKASESYAQNWYAAMCNNRFRKVDVIAILRDDRWSCSWRSAGAIIASLKEQGDYLDYYCSGIYTEDDERASIGYAHESQVTDEVRADLAKLGWQVVDQADLDVL